MFIFKNYLSRVMNSLVKIICCLLIFNLAGCVKSDVSDLTQYINGIKARPKGTIKPLPERKIVEPYIFNPEEPVKLRDPFRPVERLDDIGSLGDIAPGSGIRPDISRRKEELESYSLDTLRMVGTLTLNKQLWALIKASDGTIHRVHKGNHMGRNFGEISRITDDIVELIEIVPDVKPGTWRKQQSSMALAEL